MVARPPNKSKWHAREMRPPSPVPGDQYPGNENTLQILPPINISFTPLNYPGTANPPLPLSSISNRSETPPLQTATNQSVRDEWWQKEGRPNPLLRKRKSYIQHAEVMPTVFPSTTRKRKQTEEPRKSSLRKQFSPEIKTDIDAEKESDVPFLDMFNDLSVAEDQSRDESKVNPPVVRKPRFKLLFRTPTDYLQIDAKGKDREESPKSPTKMVHFLQDDSTDSSSAITSASPENVREDYPENEMTGSPPNEIKSNFLIEGNKESSNLVSSRPTSPPLTKRKRRPVRGVVRTIKPRRHRRRSEREVAWKALRNCFNKETVYPFM